MVNAPAGRFRCAVGADIIRPVVFPLGKQRRRIAPTMHHQTFANEIRLYYVGTWYIVQHCYISRPIRFCSKICYVGGRIISARLFPPRGNNVGAKRRQYIIEHFAVKFGSKISKQGIFAILLPHRAKSVLLKNLQRWRAADSRPYTDVPHRTWCVFSGGQYF